MTTELSHAEFFEMARQDGEQIHVWTHEEILAEPDHGWFYGLVMYEGRERLAEIYPGAGGVILDDPLKLTDEAMVEAMSDCWGGHPAHDPQEAQLRAGAKLAEQDQRRAEAEEHMLVGRICDHPTRRPVAGNTEWCPECWQLLPLGHAPKGTEEDPHITIPPELIEKLLRGLLEGWKQTTDEPES